MKRVCIPFTLALIFLAFATLPAMAERWDALREEAKRAATHHGDIASQGRAADLLYRVAENNPGSLPDQIKAMQQMDTHLSMLKGVAEERGLEEALLAGYDRMIEHGDRVLAKYPGSAEIMVLRALAFARKGQFQGIRKSLAVIGPTFEALHQAYETDPAALEGLGPLVLGRMYFEVPGFFGGDSERSIRYLEEALGYRPRDVTAMRFLAESYRDEGERKKAETTLAKIVPVKLSTRRQEAADELFIAAGLARDWKLGDLEDRILAKRRKMMAENPGLMDAALRKN